jgi:alanyl-tRNA synthetase
VAIDRVGFDGALSEQRERSRSGKKAELAKHAELTSLYSTIQSRVGDTEFLGYETTTAEGRVVAIIRDGMEFDELTGHGEAEVVFDRTPFYAEGGGQVGDQGTIREPGGGSELFAVEDTQKPVGGLIVHRGTLHGRLKVGEIIEGVVDAERRAHTMRNHTGTHLLHRALRNVVGDTARQAGSLVDPAYLRFDYPFDRALTDDEKRAIEDEVRAIVRDDRPLTVEYLPMAEAIEHGADAFFDEKYGETVRTVRVKDYSFELCGGTHCRATGQIGSFVITGERSIGSGQRRIEALTGAGADRYIRARLEALDQVAEELGAQSVDRVPERIGALQQDLREAKRRAGRAVAASPKPAELAARAEEVAPGARAVIATFPYESMDALKAASKDVRSALGNGVIAMFLDADAPQVWVTVSDDLVDRGLSAGDLVKVAAGPLGAKGGGRPQMAQGMGTRREGLADAERAVRESIAGRLGTGG